MSTLTRIVTAIIVTTACGASASPRGPEQDPPPPPPPTLLPNPLDDAVCIDGSTAVVWANRSSAKTWVIQVGPGNGGAGLPCWMNFPWLHPLDPPG